MKAIIKRDGKIVHQCAVVRGSEVLAWFMSHTNQSMDYALRYDGYTVDYIEGDSQDEG